MSYPKPSIHDFKNWIGSWPEGRVVGRSCSSYRCPLAVFLADFTCSSDVRVYDDRYVITAGHKMITVEIADWMSAFIKLADDDELYMPTPDITKEQAIEFLEIVAHQMGMEIT